MELRSMIAMVIGIAILSPVLAQTQTSLIFPRLVTTSGTSANPDDSETTGFAVVNLDSGTATLTFTAYDSSGKPIAGAGITNPAVLTLEAGKQLAMLDFQIFGSGIIARKPVGWVQVDSTVRKVTGFFLMFNDSLSVMDGADASNQTYTTFVLPDLRTNCPETESGCTNQILVSNPGNENADLRFELVRANGQSAAQRNVTLQSKSIVSYLLPELFPILTVQASDYLRVASSKAVVGFQMFGKKGRYVAGMNGLSTAAGAGTLYCPQYVAGGEDYRTDLSIINLENTPGKVTLTLFNNAGVMQGKPREVPIEPNGKVFISDQKFFVDPGTQLIEGYLQIKSDLPKLTGSVVFGDPARARFSSALPLIKTLGRSYIVGHIASNDTYFTGLALVNPNPERIIVSIQVYDEKGILLATSQERVLPGQRKSQLLWQYIPAFALASRTGGYIKLTEVGDPDGKTNFAFFTLFGTNDLTVLSAIPPQIAP